MRAGHAAKEAIDLRAVCRVISEASPMPIAVVEGSSHTVRYVNPAFCRLAGKSEKELIGKAFCTIAPAEDECLSLLDRVFRTGQPETHIGQEGSGNGSLYWSCNMWPIASAYGAPTAVVVEVMESAVSHRRTAAVNQELLIGLVRQHEAIEAANAQLRAELDKRQHAENVLRRANEDLKQFAFAASHELQEPLRMITNYSQLLEKRYRRHLDENASVYIDYIIEGTERMAALLEDLLSFTKAAVDREAPLEFVDFNLVLEKAMQNLDMAIEESEAVVTSDDLPSVRGHPAHFVQLFQNLIGNAIKYHGACPARVHVSAEEINGEWRFAVADNGVGIAPQYHEQIFGLFKRLHGGEIQGTGIGLAICRRVVERYGGSIWLESQVGQGTTFYFTLPAAKDGE